MSEGNVVVFSFLKSVGLFKDDDEFVPGFRKSVENASVNFAKHNAKRPDDLLGMRALLMLCLLGHVNDVTGTGLPSNLMEHSTELVGAFFKRLQYDDWVRAGQRINNLNWPPAKAVPKQRVSRSKKN